MSNPPLVDTPTGQPTLPARPMALRFLLILFAWTTLVFWLPTVRSAFDGQSYEWNLFGFGGAGLGGDYWFVFIGSALALGVQFLGWRVANAASIGLLLAWFAALTAGGLYLALTSPEDFRFRGDTLGLDFSIAWIAPLLFGAATAVAVSLLIKKRAPRTRELHWTRRNRLWLAGLAALLPLQFLLLRFGSPHGLSDQAAVLVTIAQWLLVSRALRSA